MSVIKSETKKEESAIYELQHIIDNAFEKDDIEDQKFLVKLFEESDWESTKKKLECDGLTWYVWFMDGIRKYINMSETRNQIYHVYTTGVFRRANSEGDQTYREGGYIEPQLLQKAIDNSFDEIDGNLAQFIWNEDKIYGIVVSILSPVVQRCSGGTFTLCWTVQTNKELTPEEKVAVVDYITGQCSDGWGEGFEQQDLKEECDTVELDCPDCEGTGDLVDDETGERTETCPYCRGKGIDIVPCTIWTSASPWHRDNAVFNPTIVQVIPKGKSK